MALDKAVDSAKLNADLTTVANAIRTKGGTSAQLNFPAGFVAAVDAIQTGGPAPVIQALTVTENGTYNVPSGVDGYGPVNVNVAGSGGGFDPAPLSKIDIMSWTFGASVGYLDIPKEKMDGLTLFVMFNLSNYPMGSHGFDIGISSIDGAAAPGWRAFDTFRCDPKASTRLVHVKEEPYGLNMATGRVTFSFNYDIYPAAGDTYVGVLFYK